MKSRILAPIALLCTLCAMPIAQADWAPTSLEGVNLIVLIDGADRLKYTFLNGLFRQVGLTSREVSTKVYTYEKTGTNTGHIVAKSRNPVFEVLLTYQSEDGGSLTLRWLPDQEVVFTRDFRVEPPPGVLDLAGYWVYIDYPYVWSNALQRWFFVFPDWDGLWMADMTTDLWYLQSN